MFPKITKYIEYILSKIQGVFAVEKQRNGYFGCDFKVTKLIKELNQ